MARLGKPGLHPEGRFFPDTYTYSKGSTDIALLQRAMRAMDKKLDAAWAARASDVPLKTADEALIMASIVEKETGKAAGPRRRSRPCSPTGCASACRCRPIRP